MKNLKYLLLSIMCITLVMSCSDGDDCPNIDDTTNKEIVFKT